MKKLLLVYNPNSSHHAAVEREVLAVARGLQGFMVGKYAIKKSGFADNVENIERVLNDGDLVVVAGGDGTATMAINGALLSGKDVMVSVLGYGNFNDIANMFGQRKPSEGELLRIIERWQNGQEQLLYPLEISVNGEHWRYAPCYSTIGLLAGATQLLEEPKVREKLKTGKESTWFSLRMAVKWYLRNRKKHKLLACKVNGEEVGKRATDYLAVNGPTLAKMMKGGEWWQEPEVFGSSVQSLGSFWKMVRFGLKSINSGVPLAETTGDVIEFDRPSEVEIHVEGEYERLEKVEKIEVRKAGKALRIVGN